MTLNPMFRPGIAMPGTTWYPEDFVTVASKWGYDWSPNPPVVAGIETVPMIWGRTIPLTVGGNSPYLLAFNEPDLASQSNIPPAEAATLFRQIETRFAGKSLIAPAPSQLNKQWIVDWHNSFISQFGVKPKIIALAAHAYCWTAQNAIAELQWWMNFRTQTRAKFIWLTEFNFWEDGRRTPEETWQEARTLINWMVAQGGYFPRWAWFTNRDCVGHPWCPPPGSCSFLANGDGTPTYYGEQYRLASL